MMSPRFARWVAAMALVALVPTVVHSYLGLLIDDGRRLAQLPAAFEQVQGRDVLRRPGWMRDNYRADEFTERLYALPTGEVRLFAARSFDPKALYHHPELGVLHGVGLGRARVVNAPGRGDIPLFVLEGQPRGIAVYALEYQGQFVSDPLWFQARLALSTLVQGKHQMAILLVHDPAGSAADLGRSAGVRLLMANLGEWTATGERRP